VAREEKLASPMLCCGRVTLIDAKRDAIGKIVMHNREHVVLIRP
jgi:non-homologous end joining protein Ku